MRIAVNMAHGHPPGWAPEEIGLFIDSYCRAGKPLPVPAEPKMEGDLVSVSFQSTVPLKKAQLHYTQDTGVRAKRTWQSMEAKISNGVITAARPPADANTWFVSLTDERGGMVTTSIQFQ